MKHERPSRKDLLIGLALFLVTLALFAPLRTHDFINYDDQLYVTDNRIVQSGLTSEGISWAFGRLIGNGTYWHPLTWLSHMLDCELFSMDAGKHHLVSLLLHSLNVVLLFLLLRKVTGSVWRSAVVAALFGWHPLQMDSVAWVAERKNLLSTLFYLLAMLAYVRYARLRDARQATAAVASAYGLILLCFGCALMSKPSVVTLPCILLLLDVWPLRRIDTTNGLLTILKKAQFWRLFLEKVPMLAMSIAAGLITIIAHRKLELITSTEHLSLTARLVNSAVAYWFYLRKTFLPTDLAVYYPMPDRWPGALIGFAAVIVAGLTILALRSAAKRPHWFAGWFWFFGALLPFIGLVQVNDQAMADRFAYLPIIGLFVVLVWSAAEMLSKLAPGNNVLPIAVATTLLVAVVGFSRSHLSHWKNSETLFRHALSVTKNNNIAHINLGAALEARGDLEGALAQYEAAVPIKPNSMAQSNLGVVLAKLGRLDEALPHFIKAVDINPDNPDARSNYGLALMYTGKLAEAEKEFREAVRLKPEHGHAHHNLANALAQSGKHSEAGPHYETTVRLQPDNWEARNNFALNLLKLGKEPEAEAEFLATLRNVPGHAPAHYNVGNLRLKSGRYEDAREHFKAAVTSRPDYPEAHYKLAIVLKSLGTEDEAKVHFQEAARLRPSLKMEIQEQLQQTSLE